MPLPESLRCQLWPACFPLRVVDADPEYPGASFEIWTRQDETPGNLNNFTVCSGFQHRELADWVCHVLNAAGGAPALSGDEIETLVALLCRLDPRQLGEVMGFAMCRIAKPPRHTKIDLEQNPPSYGHMMIRAKLGLPVNPGLR